MEKLNYPEHFDTLSKILQDEVISYLKSMDERQFKAYLIAKEHLGSSFNIFKSNGYKEWKSKTD